MMDEFDDVVASDKMKRKFFALCHDLSLDPEKAKERVKEKYRLDSFANVSISQLNPIIEALDRKLTTKQTREALLAFFQTFPPTGELTLEAMKDAQVSDYPNWIADYMMQHFDIRVKQ